MVDVFMRRDKPEGPTKVDLKELQAKIERLVGGSAVPGRYESTTAAKLSHTTLICGPVPMTSHKTFDGPENPPTTASSRRSTASSRQSV